MGKCLFMRKGETHSTPISGILASELAVGSSVYLMENGSPVQYLVVNQGIPQKSTAYASSCDGTWLLRKDIWTTMVYRNTNNNGYVQSDIHTYLNSTFLENFDSATLSIISDVKIPAWNGKGDVNTSGKVNLTVKSFVLSALEVGFTSSDLNNLPKLGARLDYFRSGTAAEANTLRVAYYNGSANSWWTRSPNCGGDTYAFTVKGDGDSNQGNVKNSSGVRPALILPFNAVFDKDTLLLKGVA